MNPETRYKLTALAFFFVLFTAFFLQFVFPYHLDSSVISDPPKLSDNLLIVPIIVLAAVVYALQVKFYFPLRHKVKIIPLLGAGLVLVLLVYIHRINRAQNLDATTTSKIIELLKK